MKEKRNKYFRKIDFTHEQIKKYYDNARHKGVTPKSANALIQDFVKLGILKETRGYQRNRIFEFQEYLSLFKK